jgi:hypothetical protein
MRSRRGGLRRPMQKAKLNRAWGGGKTADRMGKKLRPVDRVAKRVIMPGPRGKMKR